jgi:hypothetical protein
LRQQEGGDSGGNGHDGAHGEVDAPGGIHRCG